MIVWLDNIIIHDMVITHIFIRYNIHGDCKGKVMVHPSKPTLLKWDLDEECKETITSCLEVGSH